jgi:Uma2 family endonuclease
LRLISQLDYTQSGGAFKRVGERCPARIGKISEPAVLKRGPCGYLEGQEDRMSALPESTLSRMTVAEFIDRPGDGTGLKHQLIDGEPQAMASASITRGTIQATLARLLGNHLAGTAGRVVIEPGVVPRVRAEFNMRVPDIAVTRAPDDPASRTLIEPILPVEVVSPSNEAATRAKVWAYATIPSVREILLVRSTRIAAELIRREPDGGWPANPSPIGEEDRLISECIGFECPLPAIYEDTRFAAARR